MHTQSPRRPLLSTPQISRASIDAVKDHFREEMTKPDWKLMVELKKQFEILWLILFVFRCLCVFRCEFNWVFFSILYTCRGGLSFSCAWAFLCPRLHHFITAGFEYVIYLLVNLHYSNFLWIRDSQIVVSVAQFRNGKCACTKCQLLFYWWEFRNAVHFWEVSACLF